MNGKFYAQFVTPLERDERYARIDFDIFQNHGGILGEISPPNPDTNEVAIKFYGPDIQQDALEFINFLQATVDRLIKERAPKNYRRNSEVDDLLKQDD